MGELAFYGVTSSGGASNLGTVYRITASGQMISLVSFVGTNGANPQADLVLSGDGNFYGTTYYGGANDWPKAYGTVFRITTNRTLVTLVSFNNFNGAGPSSGLTEGPGGRFYGTSAVRGSVRLGPGFKLP